jgi:hypothetical protein
MKRMSTLANNISPERKALANDLYKYKEESERVRPISAAHFSLAQR